MRYTIWPSALTNQQCGTLDGSGCTFCYIWRRIKPLLTINIHWKTVRLFWFKPAALVRHDMREQLLERWNDAIAAVALSEFPAFVRRGLQHYWRIWAAKAPLRKRSTAFENLSKRKQDAFHRLACSYGVFTTSLPS